MRMPHGSITGIYCVRHPRRTAAQLKLPLRLSQCILIICCDAECAPYAQTRKAIVGDSGRVRDQLKAVHERCALSTASEMQRVEPRGDRQKK